MKYNQYIQHKKQTTEKNKKKNMEEMFKPLEYFCLIADKLILFTFYIANKIKI